MDIEIKLRKIWEQDYINRLPEFVKSRGFAFSKNRDPKDILITGINPSFREGEVKKSFGFDFQEILTDTRWDNYWEPLRKMVYNPDTKTDLRNKSAYLDIFFFREQDQKKLKNAILKINDGVQFLVNQLKVTQYIIEDIIKPKVIIVKNKESAIYWGKYAEDNVIWMGYQLEHVEDYICGELFRITGLIKSDERIAPEINETNLKNTLVLFSHHINQYTKREKRPTPELLNELLEKY